MEEVSDTGQGTVGALGQLPLPPPDSLSQQQVRGVTCVWDGVALAPETAVDLGQRHMKPADGEHRWFPRACVQCVTARALRALYDHTDTCGQCRSPRRGSACPEGRALLRLSIRGGR